MKADTSLQAQPVIADLKKFDTNSGLLLERIFFNHRGVVVITCLILTLILGFTATKLRVNAGFEKMIPIGHPYIKNFMANRDELKGLGNAIRIAVEAKNGSILDAEYLDILQKMNDEVFLLPGVDRPAMKSLWTPNMHWIAVTEDGLAAGQVIDLDWYDRSPAALERVQKNIERSGEIGRTIANDFKSSAIYVPLIDRDAETGKPLNYKALSDSLEAIRQKYEKQGVKIHIIGFAKIVGDLIDGLKWFVIFFTMAILIDAGLRQWYIRDLRSMSLLVGCSLIAVLWLLGLLPVLGYELDPYSVLVPFLIFSIGMSHGSQKMNGVLQDIGRGTHKQIAARYTFRRLFLAGLTALLADAVGFAVLMLINIQVIHDLAIAASIGVAILIFTNLILLPVLLSYTGVSKEAAQRSLREEHAQEAALREGKLATAQMGRIWRFFHMFTERKWAAVAVIGTVILAVVGFIGREDLKIGDLDPGAPELRPNSRYNLDNKFMVDHFGTSSDVLVVFAKTPNNFEVVNYDNLLKVDALEQEIKRLDGVQTTASLASFARMAMIALNEGNLRWGELLRNPSVLGAVTGRAPHELFNEAGSLGGVYAYLKDHKAETLTRVVDKADAFAKVNNSPELEFMLAAGNSGIDAATNIVVKKACHDMLYWIYGAVALLCFITFRSWRAVLVAIIPLAVTSILCEALMAKLGMGVKVATLPVIALGVGIGVDYALYVLSVVLARLREGMTLGDAYYSTLCFTGRIVVLTGLTLAFGVATWAFAPIKFQADMGILLLFMFIWNMLGALILLPSLTYFLFPEARKREAKRKAVVTEEAVMQVRG